MRTARQMWIMTGMALLSCLAGPVTWLDAAEPATLSEAELEAGFSTHVKPFLERYCTRCHNGEKLESGIRVDHLTASIEDRWLKLWEGIRRQVADQKMPPEDALQPSPEQRQQLDTWVRQALLVARSRPTPKNGGFRRLTVAQYRNTLRELLLLEDELTDLLPPDAVSRDGFLNQQETLNLSPLLLEAYFEIAEEALRRTIVDPRTPPTIQNFRVDLGKTINSQPCPDRLILGADSLLLENADFLVTELTPSKPFAFEPFRMRTAYRFIEGYQGNDTVRGWREYNSIYHAVFACMRGSHGYPKGDAYRVIPEGLLLRPAIPSAELFQVESTYGPKANFKISLRELPEQGLFRVTVTAARYDDGLLLDPGTPPAAALTASPPKAQETTLAMTANVSSQPLTEITPDSSGVASQAAAPPSSRLQEAAPATTPEKRSQATVGTSAESSATQTTAVTDPQPSAVRIVRPQAEQTVMIPASGIYQVDVHRADMVESKLEPDASRLNELRVGAWRFDSDLASDPVRPGWTGRYTGNTHLVDSPFGRAISLDGDGDAVVVTRQPEMEVGTGEFTVAAWIHPRQLRQAGIVCLGKYAWAQGWYLDMPNDRGVLRMETVGPNQQPNGTIASAPNTIRVNTWQHVAAVVRRSPAATQLFVNGYVVAQGEIQNWNLDNPRVDLHLGRIQDAQAFLGELDEVVFFRRALETSEIQALVQPGRQFVPPPPREKPQNLTLHLGQRQFSGLLDPPAFLAVRLPAGPLIVRTEYAGVTPLDRIELTQLQEDAPVARQFAAFEQRSPRLGVHLGLRRDCGSTLAPVGPPQPVSSTTPQTYSFIGAIKNFPSPDVEKDNVNYLAGIREIGVRSEYTDGRDMPRLLIQRVEFEGPYYESWPPQAHQQIMSDSPREGDLAAQARKILRDFATRAYRRPVTAQEENVLWRLFQASQLAGESFSDSIQQALIAVLTSPPFLFLIETSQSPAAEPLSDEELSAKLAFFLWNGPPDRELLDLAASGSLRQQLTAQTARLIEDPKFSRFVTEFANQWLSLEKFDLLEPDRQRFPRLTRDVRAELRHEPARFLEYLIHNNLPIKNLILSDFVLANEVVASYYDLGSRTNSGFAFVPIEHGRSDLGGVLGQAAILAGLSNGRESNPIKRGAWVARKIVAEPPDDPPPNVPPLAEDLHSLPLREQLERHRQQPGCAACHAKIDPWGLPLEDYDAGGRLKLQPADSHAILPDLTPVADSQAFRRYLAEQRLEQVTFSFLKHLTTYAIGRTLTYPELESLRQLQLQKKDGEWGLRDLVHLVVQSPMFLEK